MGDITEDVVLAYQQQSTEDKTELCVGVQPAENDNMRGSKQELVVTVHKIIEIEDRSEFCINKIVQVDEETIPEITKTSQQQEQSDKKEEFCIGLVLPIIVAPRTSTMKSSIVIKEDS